MKALLLFLTIVGISINSSLAESASKNILVQIEWIEVNSEQFEKIVAKSNHSGTKIHSKLQPLIKNQKAKVIESSLSMANTANTENATLLNSALQYVYPTEYDPPSWPNQFPKDTSLYLLSIAPTAFEERPVGLVVEIEANISSDKHINLDLEAEKVELEQTDIIQHYKHEYGVANSTFPRFSKSDNSQGITLKHNTWQLLSVNTVIQANGSPETGKSIACFVRAIIQPIQ